MKSPFLRKIGAAIFSVVAATGFIFVSPALADDVCGDGAITGVEACDDSNVSNGDGCSDSCAIESGYLCSGTPSVCHEVVCGDGVIDSPEECDDDGTANGDGCSNACVIEDGYSCTGAPSDCSLDEVPPECGDGITNGDDQCDDGNTDSGDGCSNICEFEVEPMITDTQMGTAVQSVTLTAKTLTTFFYLTTFVVALAISVLSYGMDQTLKGIVKKDGDKDPM